MRAKNTALALAAILGVICGLAVVLFLLGYFSGTAQKVPVVVNANVETPEDLKAKYQKKISVVKLPAGAKLSMERVSNLEELKRYKNERNTLFSVDTRSPGSIWSEDLVLGFADGGAKDNVIYICQARGPGGLLYSFYSTFKNCWGLTKIVRKAEFTLARTNPSPLHIPLYGCVTAEKVRYASLNAACESAEHSVKEVLGFVRASTVLAPEDKPESER